MAEWGRFSELRVSPYFKNIPHFILIPVSLIILEWWNWLVWSGTDWNVLWMISLLCHLSFHVILGMLKWWRNDGMRWNEGDFGSGKKIWILKHLSFHHHSVIPASFQINESDAHLEWHRNEQEWGLNEWIRCGLFIRDHTWFIHSDPILPIPESFSHWFVILTVTDFNEPWNDIGMSRNDLWMNESGVVSL